MPTRKELIITRLTEEGAKTANFFRTLPTEHWKQQVYTVGPEWGAHDILCHFISVERTLAIYYDDLAKGGTGWPRDFDLDVFNAREVKALRDANYSHESLIEQFERQRETSLALVQTLTDPDFDRIGFHPWFGDTPLENMLKLVYRHTMLHIRDLNKAIDTGQPVPHVDITPPSKTS
jgi:hypothetical protein